MFDAWERKIIEEALNGDTIEKTAEKLNITPYDVKRVMKKLSEQEPYTYNRILMERSLSKKIIDKDILEFLSQGIYTGQSSLELSYNLEHSADIKNEDGSNIIYNDQDIKAYLRDILTQTAVYKDLRTYQELITKLEENNSLRGFKTFINFQKNGIDSAKYLTPNTYKVYENTLRKNKLVSELRELPPYTGISELASRYGLLTSAVRDILLGKDNEKLLETYYGEEEASKIIDSYEERINAAKKITVGKVAYSYTPQGNSRHDYKCLQYIRSNQEMILKLILEYRLTVNGLAKIFHFDRLETLEKEIIHLAGIQPTGDDLVNAIRYSFYNYYHDMYSNQTLAMEKEEENTNLAIYFFNEYLTAQKEDEEKRQKLYDKIDDLKYKKILAKNRSFADLNESDQREVIKYRLKYVLPYRRMPFPHTSMTRYCPKDLRKEWDLVNEYNTTMTISEYRYRNKR